MMGRVVGGVFHLRDHLHEVPVHVIPCIEGRTDGKGVFAQASTWGSIMPAAWSFMLAARSRGLGTVWTTFHLFHEQEAAELLGIPFDEVMQAALIPVAYTIELRTTGGAGAARHDGALGPLVTARSVRMNVPPPTMSSAPAPARARRPRSLVTRRNGRPASTRR